MVIIIPHTWSEPRQLLAATGARHTYASSTEREQTRENVTKITDYSRMIG